MSIPILKASFSLSYIDLPLLGNQKPHMNKVIQKDIMLRSRLKSIANKLDRVEDRLAYKSRLSFILSVLRVG